LEIANKGLMQSLKDNTHLLNGLNVYQGHITYEAVARAQGREYLNPQNIFH
jgi:alanine dehydrogenase